MRVSVASLGLLDAIAYRSGKGMSVQLGSTLITVNEALYVGTWFSLCSFSCPSAHWRSRRVIACSAGAAIAIAVVQLVTTAVSLDNLGEMTFTLWLVWIVGASIALARGTNEQAPARAFPQRA